MAEDETKADTINADDTPKGTTVTTDTTKEEPKPEPEVIVDEPPKDDNTSNIEQPENKEDETEPLNQTDEQRTNTLQVSKSEPDLAKTFSTDAVESKAANQLTESSLDISKLRRSIFANEGRWTGLWIMFTATYWTLVIWVPTLQSLSFVTPGLFAWCVGFVGLLSSGYTLYEGKYPSGATKDDPYQTNGIGRWTAFVLTGTVIIDFCILSLWGMLNGTSTADQIRGSCHLVHIFWCSLFFYGKFRKTNPEIATTAFFLEWFDMVLSCAVIFVLHNAEGDEGCFDKTICIVYFVYVILELFGWIFPMILIESWGTQKNAKIVSTHLFFLDLVTDIMVMLAVLTEESYKINGLIMFDIIWKTFSVIRSFSYYAVYQLWLNKGRKVFKRTRGLSFN